MLSCLTGDSYCFIPKFMQEHKCNGSHPPCGTSDQDLSSLRKNFILLKTEYTEGSGETGGTQLHAFHQREPFRFSHQPGTWNPYILAKAARSVHPEVIAGADYLITRHPLRTR